MLDIYDENFGVKVKEILKRCEVTQREFAAFLGISYGTLNFALKKRSIIQAEILEFIDLLEKEVPNEDDCLAFPQWVSRKLKRHGVLQEDFAKRLGLAHVYFRNIMRTCSKDRKQQIIEALGTSDEVTATDVAKMDNRCFGLWAKERLQQLSLTHRDLAIRMGISRHDLYLCLRTYVRDIPQQIQAEIEKIEADYLSTDYSGESFWEAISRRLRFCGITEADFAALMGMTHNTLYQIKRPRDEERRQIVEMLEHIEIEYHKSGKDKLKPKSTIFINRRRKG